MDKDALRQAIIAALKAEFTLLNEAANVARDEATNEESRAEDRYDMRSQSAAYLAAGQARAAGEVADALQAYATMPLRRFGNGEPIANGALVVLEARERQTRYFFGPMRGGLEVELDGAKIVIVTAASPLGRQLLGLRVGESVLLPGKPKPIEHRVVAVE